MRKAELILIGFLHVNPRDYGSPSSLGAFTAISWVKPAEVGQEAQKTFQHSPWDVFQFTTHLWVRGQEEASSRACGGKKKLIIKLLRTEKCHWAQDRSASELAGLACLRQPLFLCSSLFPWGPQWLLLAKLVGLLVTGPACACVCHVQSSWIYHCGSFQG